MQAERKRSSAVQRNADLCDDASSNRVHGCHPNRAARAAVAGEAALSTPPFLTPTSAASRAAAEVEAIMKRAKKLGCEVMRALVDVAITALIAGMLEECPTCTWISGVVVSVANELLKEAGC